jgi:hypothetical protein
MVPLPASNFHQPTSPRLWQESGPGIAGMVPWKVGMDGIEPLKPLKGGTYPLQQSAHAHDAATSPSRSSSRGRQKDFTQEDYPPVPFQNRLTIRSLNISVAQIFAA